jgi:hypothetical protein
VKRKRANPPSPNGVTSLNVIYSDANSAIQHRNLANKPSLILPYGGESISSLPSGWKRTALEGRRIAGSSLVPVERAATCSGDLAERSRRAGVELRPLSERLARSIRDALSDTRRMVLLGLPR